MLSIRMQQEPRGKTILTISKLYIYYVSEEVHEDKEAAKEFLKSRRKEKKE